MLLETTKKLIVNTDIGICESCGEVGNLYRIEAGRSCICLCKECAEQLCVNLFDEICEYNEKGNMPTIQLMPFMNRKMSIDTF